MAALDRERPHGHDGAQARYQNEFTASGSASSKAASGQMNSYDPARISQWAIHSATGPSFMPEYEAQEEGSIGHGNDNLQDSISSQMPTQFPVSQSNAYHASNSHALYGPGMTYNESSTASAGANFAGLAMDSEILPGPGLGFTSALCGDSYSNGLASSIDDHVYSPFAAEDVHFDPAHPSMMLGNNDNGFTLSSPWASAGASMTQPLEWSPASGLTPSSSSMQSSNSLLGHQPDTPVSALSYDGMFTTSHNGPLDVEHGMVPPFSLGEIGTPQTSMGYMDPERFAPSVDILELQPNVTFSTIRPHQNLQRAPLPMDMWTGYNTTGQAYGLPLALGGVDGSRRSSEGEVKTARDHAFYKAQPKDGLYYCPYATTENCTHRPEKLKCNYE